MPLALPCRTAKVFPRETLRQVGSGWFPGPSSSRVVFNLDGNKYRVILAIDYERQLGFVGPHVQYDQINTETV
jgi:hypothetical protein